MLNLHSWVVLLETEAGIPNVRYCGLPAEQPLSAAVLPAAELKLGSVYPSKPHFSAHKLIFIKEEHAPMRCTPFSSDSRLNV